MSRSLRLPVPRLNTVLLERDSNGSLLATYAPVPELAYVGDDENAVPLNALGGMESALEFYLYERRPVPVPPRAS